MSGHSSQDVRDVAETILRKVGETATSIQSRTQPSGMHPSSMHPSSTDKSWAAERLAVTHLEELLAPLKDPLLARAAQPTLDRVLQRLVAIPEILRPMWVEIGCRFFDSKHTIAKIKKKVGAGTWHTRLFLKTLGITAQQLRLECKMEMGLRLLRDTPKTVEQVADAIGYDSTRSLGLLCHRWCGLRPAELRNRLKTPELRELPEHVFSWFFLERLHRGELSAEEVRPVLEHLESLYVPTV